MRQLFTHPTTPTGDGYACLDSLDDEYELRLDQAEDEDMRDFVYLNTETGEE